VCRVGLSPRRAAEPAPAPPGYARSTGDDPRKLLAWKRSLDAGEVKLRTYSGPRVDGTAS